MGEGELNGKGRKAEAQGADFVSVLRPINPTVADLVEEMAPKPDAEPDRG